MRIDISVLIRDGEKVLVEKVRTFEHDSDDGATSLRQAMGIRFARIHLDVLDWYRRRSKKLVAIGLLCLTLAGCVSMGNPRVKEGMGKGSPSSTKAELLAAYGEPERKSVVTINGRTREIWAWRYWDILDPSRDDAHYLVNAQFDVEGKTVWFQEQKIESVQ